MHIDFDKSPLLVIWETTQACSLACVHCRASAQPCRNAAELTTAEGFRLIDEVKHFGNPLIVFTGGDPFERPDIFELLEYSVRVGLRTNVSPSATPLLTNEAIARLKATGVNRMALSLDGATADSHDAFRGIEGTFDRAMIALEYAKQIGLDVQLQTTVTRRNRSELDQIAAIGEEMKVKMWSLFFLIVTGRALENDDLTAEEYEDVFEDIYRISRRSSFELKTTEAMHYRRFLARKYQREHITPDTAHNAPFRTAGVSDGKGFVFVSHTGEIYPSGFLPISGGNVRTTSLVDAYRHKMLFQVLRDPDLRTGKCGCCEYRKVCGGSRSRAFALNGDVLGSDPRCVYVPAELVEA